MPDIVNRIVQLAIAGEPMPLDLWAEALEQGYDPQAIYDHAEVDNTNLLEEDY